MKNLIDEIFDNQSLEQKLNTTYPSFIFKYLEDHNMIEASIKIEVEGPEATFNAVQFALQEANPEFNKIKKDLYKLRELRDEEIKETKLKISELNYKIKALKELLHDEFKKTST